MIVGLGSDMVDVRRIEAVLARHGERFTHRLFTAIERARCERGASPAAGYARRFAAKEACAKALGTGFRAGVFWRDLGVVNLPGGRPTLELTGAARTRLQALIPAGHIPRIDVTLTDELPYAQAVVIIQALPG